MLIPYHSDAPLYHRPIGTLGLIALNVVVFVLMTQSETFADSLVLQYGPHLSPAQWLTSNFAHASFSHLMGNMLFLWCFGMIIEGKVGFLKFLLIYLSIGLLQNAAEQLIFWNSEGTSLGASSIIFGLMAICLLWAPKNEISVLCLFFYRVFHFEVSVLMLSLYFIGTSIILLCISPTLSSTDFLHLMGVIVGAPIGYYFLKYQLVECEGWDLLSLRKNKAPIGYQQYSESFMSSVRRREKEKLAAPKKKKSVDAPAVPKVSSKEKFQSLVRDGKPVAALRQLEQIRIVKPQFSPDASELLILARGLRKLQEWPASVQMYQEHIDLKPEAILPRIEVAEIYALVQQRPSAATRAIQPIEIEKLPDEVKRRVHKLEETIDFQKRSGVLEVDHRNL